MKLLAPIAVIIAAASARQIYTQSVENYANSAEIYQSGLEHQQRGLYSGQSEHRDKYEAENHRPAGEKTAKILEYHADNDGHHYQYVYETENGIRAEEHGETLDKGTSAQGAFSYKGDDGHVYSITYTADEHGFRPSGDHLPTPPPVPEEILKSLEQNAAAEAAGIFDDGKYHEYHEQGHQDLRQFDDGHQPEGYHSSGQAADLAYHAHDPAPAHPRIRIVHQSSGHDHSGHQSLSGHGNTDYFSSAGHSGSNLGHEATSSHVTNFGHQTHGNALSHQSQTHEAVLVHQPSHHNSGHHYVKQGIIFGHKVADQEDHSGHQASFVHENKPIQSYSHGVHLQKGFHASMPTASNLASEGYSSSPSGFSMPSTHGIVGHGGLAYLPPSPSYQGH